MLASTLERSLEVIGQLDSRIEETARLYEDRPELVGATSLIAFLKVLLQDTKRRIADEVAQAEEQKAAAKTARRDREAEEIEAEAVGVVTVETRSLVSSLELCLAVLGRPHGKLIDPFISPLTRLAGLVAEGTEMLVYPIAGGGEYQVTQPLNPKLLRTEREGEVVGRGVSEKLSSLPKLVIMEYPETEEGDSFSHLILGHEIAHLILRRNDLSGVLISDALDDFHESGEDARLQPARHSSYIDRVRRWFLELAADRLGLRLIGPGLYFALFELATLREWQFEPEIDNAEADYNQYPAFAWRLHLLAELIEAEYLPATTDTNNSEIDESAESAFVTQDGWRRIRAVVQQTKQAIPTWIDVDAGVEIGIVETALEALGELESELLPNEDRPEPGKRRTAPTKELIELLSQDANYSPAQFQRDLPVVWNKLAADIAPAERVLVRGQNDLDLARPWTRSQPWSLPIDWRSIITGAYLSWLTLAGDAAHRTERRTQLSAIARSGVELSEIHRTALDLRDELQVLRIETG